MGESYLADVSIGNTGKIVSVNDTLVEAIILCNGSKRQREWLDRNLFHSEADLKMNDSFVIEKGFWGKENATLYEKVVKYGKVEKACYGLVVVSLEECLPSGLRDNARTEFDADAFKANILEGDEIIYCFAKIVTDEGNSEEHKRYAKLTNRERHFKIRE